MFVLTVLPWMAGLVLVTIAEDLPNPGTKLKQLCSEELNDAYTLACLGSAPRMFGKRSMLPRTLPSFNSLAAYEGNRHHADWPDWPWLESTRAHNLMFTRAGRARFGKRVNPIGGLADECCLKPCYIEELLSYCPN